MDVSLFFNDARFARSIGMCKIPNDELMFRSR